MKWQYFNEPSNLTAYIVYTNIHLLKYREATKRRFFYNENRFRDLIEVITKCRHFNNIFDEYIYKFLNNYTLSIHTHSCRIITCGSNLDPPSPRSFALTRDRHEAKVVLGVGGQVV